MFLGGRFFNCVLFGFVLFRKWINAFLVLHRASPHRGVVGHCRIHWLVRWPKLVDRTAKLAWWMDLWKWSCRGRIYGIALLGRYTVGSRKWPWKMLVWFLHLVSDVTRFNFLSRLFRFLDSSHLEIWSEQTWSTRRRRFIFGFFYLFGCTIFVFLDGLNLIACCEKGSRRSDVLRLKYRRLQHRFLNLWLVGLYATFKTVLVTRFFIGLCLVQFFFVCKTLSNQPGVVCHN